MYGGPEETRTLDLSDANRTLSQLSYRPISYPFELPEYYNAEKGESQGKRFLTEKKQKISDREKTGSLFGAACRNYQKANWNAQNAA